jgi:NAD(P)H-dependent FMN reductase
MPFFAEEASPAYAAPKHRIARLWQDKIAEFDAYLCTVAEYNHAPAAVLKNAFDYAFAEWHRKPISFVGYGGVGAARAIEQLRVQVLALQMAPMRNAVNILYPAYLAVVNQGKKLSDFEYLTQSANDMLDQLAWWTDALKSARERALRQAAA